MNTVVFRFFFYFST
ncbi:pheST operon leader peptide PheM [Chimaeribacter californicus]